jgi:prepilin-type N-terminal cleavage/methylation domain-containing protein
MNCKKGFTLFEVIVAIVLISITFSTLLMLLDTSAKNWEFSRHFWQSFIEADKEIKLLKENNKSHLTKKCSRFEEIVICKYSFHNAVEFYIVFP